MPKRRVSFRKCVDDDEFETEAFRDITSLKETEATPRIPDEDGNSSDADNEDQVKGEIVENEDEDRPAESDDEEPEDVDFQDTKKAAKEHLALLLADLRKRKEQRRVQQLEIEQRNLRQKQNREKRLRKAENEVDDGDALLPAKQSKTRHSVHEESEDFIPLPDDEAKIHKEKVTCKRIGSTTVRTTDISRNQLVPKVVANFREQMQYGNHIRRESTQSMLLKQAKRQILRKKQSHS